MILKKAPLSYENICCFFFNLIIVLLHGCVTVENLIDYKKGLYALYKMINAQLLISCSKKTNQ